MNNKAFSLVIIALCQVMALSVWFAGTAALPAFTNQTDLSGFIKAALTSSIQIGFVIGALISAATGLADRYDPRRVFAAGALMASLTTAASILTEPGGMMMISLRILTGASLALVYPVGMKLAASWAKGDAGLLVGLLVGALTLGSAAPHLLTGLGDTTDWTTPFFLSALLCLISSGLILLSQTGSAFKTARRFDPAALKLGLSQPGLRLANIGYLGHMWELYAFWAWLGPFLTAWFLTRELDSPSTVSAWTFSIIAVGSVGALAAGWLADRWGRTTLTSLAMAISGSCAVLTGLNWSMPAEVMLFILVIYGITVIADSAQFSASIAELAPPDKVGSLLTLQTTMGFALTVLTVQGLSVWIDIAGIRWSFAPLAIGPAIGVWAMLRLRGLPEAQKLAGGRR